MASKEELRQVTQQLSIGAIDARGSQGTVINPHGPVTQVYGTQQNVHTGGGDYVDKRQITHFNLTLTTAGGRVDPGTAALPTFAAKPRPVLRMPDHVPALVGRDEELDTLVALLAKHRFVEIYGPVDMGKSALLQVTATRQTEGALPHGVIFLQPSQALATDLLQQIHGEFFTCSNNDFRLTDERVMYDLETIRALIVLDNDRLPKEEIELLLAALKSSHILVATRQRGGRHPGRIRTMALHGLPLPAARELYCITLERPLRQEENATVDALITALEGNPGAIIREAVIAREEQAQAGHSMLQQPSTGPMPTPTIERQAQQLLNQLTNDERSLVAVLAAVYDARLGEELLLRIAGVADTSPAVSSLIHKQIIRTSSPRYRLVETFLPPLLSAGDANQWQERVAADLARWMQAPTTTPEQILEEQEAVLQLLGQAVAAGRWRVVLSLARALETALIVGKQWGAWQQVLAWQVQAARSLQDLAAEGWALHQQGTRALCLGDAVTARTLLSQALNIRVRLRDRAGADVTRHNLNLVQPPPPPPSTTPPRMPSGLLPRSQIPAQYRVKPARQERGRRGNRWRWLLGGVIIIVLFWATLWRNMPVVPPTVAVPTISAPSVNSPEVLPTSTEPPAKETTAVIVAEPPTREATAVVVTEPPTQEAIKVVVTEPPVSAEAAQPVSGPPVTEAEEVSLPLIKSFYSDVQQLSLGETTNLYWEVLNATEVTIEPIQGQLDTSGQLLVQPQETTDYVLSATNEAGTVQSPKLLIEVIEPVAEPAKVVIHDFTVSLSTVKGMITLCYTTENAVEVVIEPDIDSVLQWGKELDKGCIEWPQKPEISLYTLIAYGESGETEKLVREYD